jgi:hypothetical protein
MLVRDLVLESILKRRNLPRDGRGRMPNVFGWLFVNDVAPLRNLTKCGEKQLDIPAFLQIGKSINASR